MLLKRLASLTGAALLAGCVFGPGAALASATLQGAGSTLVAPIEAYWATAWDNSTGNSVTYNPVGSGTGYKDIAAGQVDFGASDAPLSTYSTPSCNNCVQMPWALSATGVSFNIPGVSRLRLTGPVIAEIYLGQITNWNDHRITSLNRGVNLPNLTITPYHRSDGSGDTYAFTKYLSDVSSAFKSKVGASTTVSFPGGVGAKGNTGMASGVQGTKGAIAYIAVSYLVNDNLPAVHIKNAAGKYQAPDLNAIEAAAAAFHHISSSNEITIVNPPKRAKSAYPISTYTYVIVPTNASQGALLKSFIGYAITSGQSFGPRIDFAPLPTAVRNADQATLSRIS